MKLYSLRKKISKIDHQPLKRANRILESSSAFSKSCTSAPMVSVVIPVYKDPWRVIKTVRALLAQTYPHDRYEIILIDNGGNKGLLRLFASFSNIVVTHETEEGAFAARNKGISIAMGEILAFTDSDCIPNSNWIEMGVRPFQNNRACVIVAGEINFFFKRHGYPSAIELYDHLTSLNQAMFVTTEKYGATANLFVRKSVLDKVGVFNASLKTEGGDAELGHKIFESGMELIYKSDAIVMHPARNTLKMLIRKGLRATIGTLMTIEKYNYQKRNFFQYALYQLIDRPNLLRHAMRGLNHKPTTWMQCKIIILFFFIKTLQIAERLRVKLGGTPFR